MNRIGPVAAALLGLAAVAASAQTIGSSSLRNLDTSGPVDINADRIEALDAQHQVIFTGKVHVRQGTLTLDARRIRVNYKPGKNGADPEIQRLDADGNVVLTSPTENATANYGIYDVTNRVLTLVGNVRLVQNNNRVSGNRLTIDLASGRSTMDGETSTGQPGSRVSGRFTVPDRKN